MGKAFDRRFVLGAGLAALTSGMASVAWANAPEVSLRPKARPEGGAAAARKRSAPGVEELIKRAKLGGDVSFSVIDVKTNRVLEGHDPDHGMAPASVTKAVTALYALDTLGPGHRFETRLVATGPVEGGVLKGDLVLVGGGDPVLDTDALADMARALKQQGVSRVTGRLRPYGGALPYRRVIDNGQPEHVGYNPSLSGLNLNFNRVHFEWKRAGGGTYSVAMDARSDRYRPKVSVARMRIANRTVPVYTYQDAGEYDSWTVASGALGNGGSRWLPVRRPEEYAAEVFAELAQAQGVSVEMGRPVSRAPGGTILVRHKSPVLVTVLEDMLKYSNNLTAELVGLSASAKRLGRVVQLEASAQEMTSWARARLGMTQAKLLDHSGLGAASRLRASELAKALASVHQEGRLKPILKPFTMRDAKGNIMRDHPVKVAAKTGTLYFVSTLAGYATAPDGTELAFAIFTANDKLRRGVDSKTDERPNGSSSWNKRAKQLQQALIERWSVVHAG